LSSVEATKGLLEEIGESYWYSALPPSRK